jgi:hypothetical protein
MLHDLASLIRHEKLQLHTTENAAMNLTCVATNMPTSYDMRYYNEPAYLMRLGMLQRTCQPHTTCVNELLTNLIRQVLTNLTNLIRHVLQRTFQPHLTLDQDSALTCLHHLIRPEMLQCTCQPQITGDAWPV